LKRLSSSTGGLFSSEPKRISRPIRSFKPSFNPIWGWLLLSSLGLFIAELGLRKVRLGGARWSRGRPSAASEARAKAKPSGGPSYIERLMRAKGAG
ncbi:hypothetical protein DRP77_07720, partial [Candidatus Poribacteria bacterium]